MYSEWKKLLIDIQKHLLNDSPFFHSLIILKKNSKYYIYSYIKKKGQPNLFQERELFKNTDLSLKETFLDSIYSTKTLFYHFIENDIFIPLRTHSVNGVLFFQKSNSDEFNEWVTDKTNKKQFIFAAKILNNLISQKKYESKIEENFIKFEEKNAKISELIWKQNADYYLISLLLTPLQANKNRSSNIKTEFILKQKNSFIFKNKEIEIGGDLCITDTIKLYDDHSYTFFLNTDAMGKSIQGASGALVLGTVVEANLKRLKAKSNYNTFPEQCLKSFYLDMQNVFLSFNGSMYASICIGLIHVETGTIYYFNAEHPFTVLYRNGKAKFLEKEFTIRKLGTPDQENDFFITVLQLKDQDIIFTGSDGKDDLIVTENGEERVLDDETLFLTTVEKCNGDLESIYKQTEKIGNLKDDLSILKITYRSKNVSPYYEQFPDPVDSAMKNAKKALEEKNPELALNHLLELEKEKEKFPEVIKILGKIYFYKEDFNKAFEYFDLYILVKDQENLYILSNIYSELLKILADIFIQSQKQEMAIETIEEYLYLNPWDNEYLFNLSSNYFIYGNYTKAADCGERLFLRDKKHLPNLMNLIKTYIQLKVKDRALYLIGLCMENKYHTTELENLKSELQKI